MGFYTPVIIFQMAKRKILILNMCNHHDFYGKTVEVIEDTWAKDIIEGKYENISYYSCGAMTP